MNAKELNIGDYVRTKNEGIGKIIKIEPFMEDIQIYLDTKKGNVEFHTKDGVFNVNKKENIIKSRPNIIELLEVGDILEIKDMLGNISKVEVDENFKLLTGRIVAITTREQYEANKYKIGE